MYSQDPINQIKQTLQAYEEPYHLGAWNHFTRYRKAKKMQTLNRWLAAACVLMALSAFWLFEPGTHPAEPIADIGTQFSQPEQSTPGPAPLPELTVTDDVEKSQPVDVLTDVNPVDELTDPDPVDSITVREIPNLIDTPTESQQPMFSFDTYHERNDVSELTEFIDMSSFSSTYLPELTLVDRKSKRLDDRRVTRDDLLQERSGRNISFGLAYSSLINVHQSSSNWNIGGGLAVNWDFNETFALSSGFYLAQSRLQYDNAPVRLATVSQSSISSSAMEIDFLSLEIPLNLQYSLTDRFFLSAGVSSASFLRERYRYDYQYQEFVTTMEEINGEYQPVSQIVTISKSETTSEPSLSTFNLFAFYNFSAGYSLSRRGENRFILTFEPFIKLPTGSFAVGNISYSTGGLQIRISF